MGTKYVLALYISETPYKIKEGFALEILQTHKYNLEKNSPHGTYKIMAKKDYIKKRAEADKKNSRRDS